MSIQKLVGTQLEMVIKFRQDGSAEVAHVEVISSDRQAESSEPASGSSSGSMDAVWESIADFAALRAALAEVRAGAATIASTCRAISELADELAKQCTVPAVDGAGETRDGAQDAAPVAARTGNPVLDLLN